MASITFTIPKVPLTYTNDDGSVVTEQLEIYETFDWRGGVDTPPYESATVILQATSSSGPTSFTYTSSDPSVAVVFEDNKLKMLQRAGVAITATAATSGVGGIQVESPFGGVQVQSPFYTGVVYDISGGGTYYRVNFNGNTGDEVNLFKRGNSTWALEWNAFSSEGFDVIESYTSLNAGNSPWLVAWPNSIIIKSPPVKITSPFYTGPVYETLENYFTYTYSGDLFNSGNNANLFKRSDSKWTLESVAFSVEDQSVMESYTSITAGNSPWLVAWSSGGSESATVTISPPALLTPQTLTVTIPSEMQAGQYANFSAVSSAGLAVSVRSFSPEIVEIVGSQLHALVPGGAIIEFSAPGNASYAEVTETFFVFVEGLPQTVTFSAIPSLSVGDEVTLSATSSAGLAITFSSSDPSIMSVTGTKLKILRQGYATITATAATSSTYSPASASQDVVVGSSGQSIIFPAIPEIPYGAAGYVVAVSATSGLPVALASSNPSVAIVLGNTLSISGVGTTTITASQAGNPFWLPATSQQQLLRVVKAEQGLTFTRPPALIPLGGRVLLASSTTSGGTVQFFATGALAIENGYLVGKNIGTGTVTATVAETALYKPASITYEVTVGKLNQAISFAEVQVKSFTDFPFRLDVSSDSQLPVALTSSNPSIIEITDNNLATIKGTGVVTIEAAQIGNSTYNAAPSASRQIAVERGVQAIAFQDIAPVEFGAPSFSLKATAPGGSVAFASSNPSVARVENGNQLVIQGLGVARVIATQAGNQNYFPTVAVQSVIVLPTFSSAVAVTKGEDDTEAHSSLTSSPASGVPAFVVSAPSIEDRETHLSISPSAPLNCGGSQISLGTRDTEDHQSLTASPGFSGSAFNMGSVPQGTDESGYSIALSPAYTGASPAVGAATEVDISDYRAWLASAASSASSVVARYDGRNEFEVYFAPTAYEPVGFLKWAKSGVSGRILNRRVNEDGVELKGKIAI